jgi:hypothetical protein
LLAITVRNPNPNTSLIRVYIDDPLPEGIRAIWNAAKKGGIHSDTPAGCNDTLNLTMADYVAPGLIASGYGTGSLYGGNSRYDATLPPNFGPCTVRFEVYDDDYLAGQQINEATISSANLGGSTATAPINVTFSTTFVWSGLGGNANLSNPANWVGGVAPPPGADLVFPDTATQKNVTVDVGTTFGLVLIGPAGGYTFSGDVFNIAFAIGVSGSADFAAQLGVLVQAQLIIDIDAGRIFNLSGGIDVSAGGKAYIASHGTANITGPLALDGNLNFGGSGTTFLNGPYSGTTGSIGVGDGKLEIGANYPFPLTIGAPGTVSGTGGVGSTVNSGILRPGSGVLPFGGFTVGGSFEAKLQFDSGPPSDLPVLQISAASALRPPAGEDAVALGASSKLTVSGSATLAGTLEIEFDSLPTVGAAYTVVSAGNITGRFQRTRTTPSAVFGEVGYTNTTATYTVTETAGIFRDGFE